MLQHKFQYRASADLQEMFKGVNKFSTLVNKIKKLSEKNSSKYNPDKYKGDAFEFFVELFLNAFKYDNRIGISSYAPVQDNDNGVDGVGLNFDGKKSVVQCKFRSDASQLLTNNQDHLGNMVTDGILQHQVLPIESVTDTPRHYVFTTAKGMHHYTDADFFKGKVKCIGYDGFKTMLDDNINFWDYCRAAVA